MPTRIIHHRNSLASAVTESKRSFAHVTLAGAFARGFKFAPDAPPEAPPETLADEAGRLQTEARELFSKAKTEKRGLSEEEQKAQDQRFTRLEQIKALEDGEAKFAKLAFDHATTDTEQADEKTVVKLPTDPPGKDAAQQFTGKTAEREEFGTALCGWLKDGVIARKFATITTATNSSILLPKTIAAPQTPNNTNVFRDAHDVYNVKPIETTNTADMTVPVLDATAGGIVAENASSDTENTPSSTESIRLPTKNFQSGSVWFSNTLLLANNFNLLDTTVPQLRYSKELALEAAIAAAMIADTAITQSVATATTASFTYANLVDLNEALPKRYMAQQAILLSQAAFSAAQKLVGSDGHPVLNLDPQNQRITRFNGTPVMRCDYLEAFGATKVVGITFSLMGFKLRDVTPERLTRYQNYPGKPDQTGLNLFANHGYGWAPSAVAKFVTPAS